MKYLYIIILLIGGLCASLNTEAQENAYLSFDDISLSIEIDSVINIKKKGIFKRFLSQRLRKEKKASVYTGFLFQNSASPVNLKRFEFDRSKSSKSTDAYTRRQIKTISRSFFGDHPAGTGTHILSSIRHISAVAETHEKVHVLMFTDLKEYSPLKHMRPFDSLERAVKEGKADAARVMQKYGLKKNTSSQVNILVVLPVAQTSTSKQDFLIPYWESVFQTVFGANNVSLNYQTL